MSIFTDRSGSTRFSVCAFTACLAFWADPASALQKSFSFPPQAAYVFGGAQLNGDSLLLPNAGSPTFLITFALPLDYQNNGQVRIVVYLSGGSTCKVRLIPQSLRRKRIGSPITSNLTGLSGGNPLVDLSSFDIAAGKVFTLDPGGPLAGQKRGDAFTVQFTRQADDPTDTCNGTVSVQAIDIRYAVP
jgi:hypothetical protein